MLSVHIEDDDDDKTKLSTKKKLSLEIDHKYIKSLNKIYLMSFIQQLFKSDLYIRTWLMLVVFCFTCKAEKVSIWKSLKIIILRKCVHSL